MRKYLAVYSVSLQETLQHRWTLLMDRFRGVVLVVSLYYLWSALLGGGKAILGYSRADAVTYVLGVNFLRSFVLSSRAWDIVMDIASGRFSNFLMRPISYFGFQFARDAAQKTVLACSAILEIGFLVLIFKAPLTPPASAGALLTALSATGLSMLLYFELALLVYSTAFWTHESGGPLFCFELVLYFSAGAFFPLDILPAAVQKAMFLTPFPYLVFFPLQVYLGRAADAAHAMAVQCAWLVLLWAPILASWRAGTRSYAAVGG